MTDFDPYRDLLNIRTPDRPVDHYTLLGVDLFESSRVKIETAAEHRMMSLQELANSEHLDASQKLLNEVSAARRLLLHQTNRIAYDEMLRGRPKRSARDAPRGDSKKVSKGRNTSTYPMLPLGGTILIVLVLAAIVLVNQSGADGNVVVDWSLSERDGALIQVDGNEVSVDASDPILLNLSEGRHRVVFKRSAFQDVEKTFRVGKGKVNLSLNWVAE